MTSMEIAQFKFLYILEEWLRHFLFVAKELPAAVAHDVKMFWTDRENRALVLFWLVGVPLVLAWLFFMAALLVVGF